MDFESRTRAAPPSASHGPSLYPSIGHHNHNAAAPFSRSSSSYHHPATPPSSSGLGIRVVLKPEYRITPPPQLLNAGDVPRSNFQFDFGFERKVLAEAEKENPNWGKLGLENAPSRPSESASSLGSVRDPVVSKYVSSGLNQEAVSIAVANYGDNPAKVRDFCNAYSLLREMGFASSNVAEALLMNDNDTDKALAHFLNSPA